MPSLPFTTSLTISSDTRYLALLRQWVAAVAKIVGRAQFPRPAQTAVTLSLIEAVNNAIFHAHHGRQRPIAIELTVSHRCVRLMVVDQGRGFISGAGKKLPTGLAIHGRGLVLIRKLMHEVKSVRCPEGHTLVMVYRKGNHAIITA